MGLDKDFFVNPSESILCEICTDVYQKPLTVCHNGHVFCESCINLWREKHNNCPTCRQMLPKEWLCNRYIQRDIDNSNRRCSHLECSWTGLQSDYAKHQQQCGFTKVQCQLVGCTTWCARMGLPAHQQSCAIRRTLEELDTFIESIPKRPDPKTIAMLKEAARLNCGRAMYHLYFLDSGSNSVVLDWLERSAQAGFVEAQYTLAVTYYLPSNSDEKLHEALNLLKAAAKQGHMDSQKQLLHLIGSNQLISLTEQESKQLRTDCENLFGESECRVIQYKIGAMWEAEKDFARAFIHYQKAADSGLGLPQFILGQWYSQGKFVVADARKALHYYRMAAKNNVRDAQRILAMMYETGQGVPRNMKIAAKYYRYASYGGDLYSQYKYATFSAEGLGTRRDLENAFLHCKTAAKRNYVDAQVMLARMYHHGLGVERNLDKALYYYTKAGKKGHFPSAMLACVAYLMRNPSHPEARFPCLSQFGRNLGNDATNVDAEDSEIKDRDHTANGEEQESSQDESSDDEDSDTEEQEEKDEEEESSQDESSDDEEQAEMQDERSDDTSKDTSTGNVFPEHIGAPRYQDRDRYYILAYIEWSLGKGVNIDFATGHLTSAAEQGHVLAALRLSELYRTGSVVGYDAEKAIRYFIIATLAEDQKHLSSTLLSYDDPWGIKLYYAYLWNGETPQ